MFVSIINEACKLQKSFVKFVYNMQNYAQNICLWQKNA